MAAACAAGHSRCPRAPPTAGSTQPNNRNVCQVTRPFSEVSRSLSHGRCHTHTTTPDSRNKHTTNKRTASLREARAVLLASLNGFLVGNVDPQGHRTPSAACSAFVLRDCCRRRRPMTYRRRAVSELKHCHSNCSCFEIIPSWLRQVLLQMQPRSIRFMLPTAPCPASLTSTASSIQTTRSASQQQLQTLRCASICLLS